MKRIWIADAPAGVWSSGPSVIYNFQDAQKTIKQWEDMGWSVSGPYDLSETDGKIGDLK